ncbi:unnamed protein product [Calypogeia fissa]
MADSASTLSLLLGVLLCGVFTLLVLHYSSYWVRAPKSGALLPKGTFSWPIIGETIAITRDPLGFAISHQKRYGSVFKSSLFLRKTILGTTADFAKFVSSNPDLFPVQYPETVEFVSPSAVFFEEGPSHLAVKKLFTKFALPESLQTMVQSLESIIVANLESWEQQGTVVGSQATEMLIADTSSYVIFGVKDIRRTPEGALALNYFLQMISCIGAVPVNLPGTAYNKRLKARTALRLYLKSVVDQRRTEKTVKNDILQLLLDTAERAQGDEVKYFEEDKLIDNVVGAWFASFKTTATTLTWTLKFLVDHPHVFKKIQAEQLEILKGKNLSVKGPRLTWEDTKKMVYTSKFYQELQRTLSISYVIPRKAADNIVYNGLLIPKGWAVILLQNFLHHDPANYKDLESFNPNRFDAAPKPNTYLPFGLGSHRCPGDDIAKLILLLHIHHLTTTYKFERVGPDRGMFNLGFPTIIGGYPIRVSRRT